MHLDYTEGLVRVWLAQSCIIMGVGLQPWSQMKAKQSLFFLLRKPHSLLDCAMIVGVATCSQHKTHCLFVTISKQHLGESMVVVGGGG